VLPEDDMKEITEVFDELNTECKKRGIKFLPVFWPNKCDIYGEYMPTYEIVSELNRSGALAKYMNENNKTGFTVLYPTAELIEAKKDYATYYKYDTHWNPAGGYIGAQAIRKALGMETTDIKDVKATKKDLKQPDLIDMLPEEEKIAVGKIDDEEYTFDYRPEVTVYEETGTGAYKEFMALSDITHSVSSNENGKSMVFIGDSFINASRPYLQKDFTKTTFAHANNVTEVVDDILECDVLVFTRISRAEIRLKQTATNLIEALRARSDK
jgi:hypothetical protein